MKNFRSIALFALFIGLMFASRVVPHPANLTLVTAASLWGFSFLRNKRLAWMAPVLAMFLADLYQGFHGTYFFVYTYGAVALISVLGQLAQPGRSLGRWGLSTFAASALFFVVTNLGVFFVDRLYPMTGEGFITCFRLALEFWKSDLVADIVFSSVFLLAYRLAESRFWLPAKA